MLGCLRKKQGDVMYLSGVPGTGKTLAASSLVQKCIRDAGSDPPPLAISINCMRLKTARDVIARIIAGVKTAALKSLTGSEKSVVHVPEDDGGFVLSGAWGSLSPIEHLHQIAMTPLEQGVEKKNEGNKKRRSSISEIDLVRQTGMIVVILDEIDGMLEGRNCEEIVGSLFATAATPGSRLVLLGISNSIDLVQQLMRPGAVLHVSLSEF
jgi:Cdc6-like AAA superfamily ATPase